MAIEYEDMRSILSVLQSEMPNPNGNLLILGDAFIHFNPQQLKVMAQEIGFDLKEIPLELTPLTLGKSLGFNMVDTLDINARATITLDLQISLPLELMEKYDFVIDAGVLFWCFEPGLVLQNIYRLIKKNGLIFHVTAVSGYFGRGYYNVHPRLLEDFYLTNGCSFIQASYRTKAKLSVFQKVLGNMSVLLRLKENINVGVSYCNKPGAVYLHSAKKNSIKFTYKLAMPEPEIIPNNVVGTFAFRKTKTGEPKSPIQIC
jgi:SAM-dependent methyltransferase